MKASKQKPPARCRECGKTWTGKTRCHCMTCHVNFSSITAFDKHRVGTFDPVLDRRCADPADRGLVERDGYWGLPGSHPEMDHVAQKAS